MAELIIPTFEETNFKFDGATPDHIDAIASEPYNDELLVLTYSPLNTERARIVLAVDVPDLPTARVLIGARLNKQEDTVRAYGHMESLFISDLSRQMEWLVYDGWRAFKVTGARSCWKSGSRFIYYPEYALTNHNEPRQP